MPIFLHNSGDWKKAEHVFVKQEGTWKEALFVYVKQGGVWLLVHGGTSGCPNDISSLTATLATSGSFHQDEPMSVTVNDSPMPTSLAVQTFSGPSGTPDPNGVVWGGTPEGGISLSGYVSIVVNSTTYWTPVYSVAGTDADCCTNLVGTFDSSGNYSQAGYVAVLRNNLTAAWLPVYNKS